MNEDLEKNLFFKVLRTKYTKLYDLTSQQCCILAIPHNKYFKYVNIDEKYFLNHIFKPSPLLKSHFIPFKKCLIEDVELDNDCLIIEKYNNPKEKVQILSEKIGYNESNEIYKIFIIEKPLVKLKNDFIQYDDYPQTIFYTFEQCESYLTMLSPLVLKCIKEKLEDFIKYYLILPNYLDDAAQKIQAILDWSLQKYQNSNCIYNKDLLIPSLECYIIACLFDKIYPVLKIKFSEEDEKFNNKCMKIKQENLSLVKIGCNLVFNNYKPSSVIRNILILFFEKKAPLEKVFLLKHLLETLNKELIDFASIEHSFFSKKKINVLADDLVSILVYILINFKTNPSKNSFISELNFIQKFSYFLQNKDEFGYALVTFGVAIGYIQEYCLNTKKNESKTSCRKNNSLDYDLKLDANQDVDNQNLNDSNFNKNCTDNELNEGLDEISKLIEEITFNFQNHNF